MMFRDSLGAPMRPIGTVEITEPFEVTNQGFATASWYEKLACEPQTVVLFSNGYYVAYTVKGMVIDAYFGSSWGGVAIGSYDKERDINKMSSYTYTNYSFMFAEAYMNGSLRQDALFHLLPEYGAGCAPYQHDPSKIGYFLTMPEAGHPLLVKRAETAGFNRDEHSYQVTWRGELQAGVVVKRSEGFNGDTWQVAIRRATERLELVAA
jgi:hypothetical protein